MNGLHGLKPENLGSRGRPEPEAAASKDIIPYVGPQISQQFCCKLTAYSSKSTFSKDFILTI